MDSQRIGTMSRAVEQLSLLPVKKSACPPPDLDYLKTLPNARRAMRYAMSLADLEPKEVYDPLGMDKATWSRIENGQQAFPIDKLNEFQKLVGNDAYLLWLNHNAGYDIASMRPLRDMKDRIIQEQAQALAEKEAELETIKRFVRETMR